MKPEPVVESDSAIAEATAVAKSIAKKANKYKWMSKSYTIAIATATAAIPVLIGLPIDSDLTGKVLPSVLAALAALGAVVLTLEKPQERWSLYRRYQRVIEGEIIEYKFKVGPYSKREPQRMFAQRLAATQLQLHDEWAGLVPRSTDAALSSTGLQR